MSDRVRPDLKAWAGVAAAAAIGGAVVPSGPPGIGLLLTGAAIAAAIARAKPRPLDPEAGAFAAAALLLLSMATVLDAEWVVAVDVAAAAACSTLAITGARRWTTVFAAPLRTAAHAIQVPSAIARAIPRGSTVPWAAPAARAALASIALLVTFGALFWSADAAFAHIAGEVLLPDVGLDLLPARIFVGVAIVAGAGGLILVAQRDEGYPWTRPEEPRTLTRLEWALPLLLLDALFAAFVLVQLTVLFGGHDHVLETTGLTYAQYARAGFFQLVAIAALVLGVIAVAVKVAPPAHDRLLKALLGALCVLTLVVLASALRRMDLYEDAYGLTRIRVAVLAVDLWLAAIFVTVMVAGVARRATWLPRAAVGLSVASLLLFNAANPDALIARSAVDRWERTGAIDGRYVATLSADALPVLTALPGEFRDCTMAPIVARARSAPAPWTSFNLSRHRAQGLPITEDAGCTY